MTMFVTASYSEPRETFRTMFGDEFATTAVDVTVEYSYGNPAAALAALDRATTHVRSQILATFAWRAPTADAHTTANAGPSSSLAPAGTTGQRNCAAGANGSSPRDRLTPTRTPHPSLTPSTSSATASIG